MSSYVLYLAKFRFASSQRAHFAVFIPNHGDGDEDSNDVSVRPVGTLINVVGTAMTGYVLETKRNHDCRASADFETCVRLGTVQSKPTNARPKGTASHEGELLERLEEVAGRLPPPRKSENFLAPVNDLRQITNRRCQEWTIDYLRELARLGYIDRNAVQLAQAERDAPAHGIGLRPTATGRGD
ncbi:hypothetical protein LTR37_010956 [Vermiconidia calcicola]|uniref:Uncharacterized protein n=1 Tax=Vermiconidia calcicola TaxID=1690605 RepID=A0ACC3N467_9PEZI|nr:hypothetical protein LTR37_010956 [Vermiconidia calcicola]